MVKNLIHGNSTNPIVSMQFQNPITNWEAQKLIKVIIKSQQMSKFSCTAMQIFSVISA